MFETVSLSLNAYTDESIAPIRCVGIGGCDSKDTSYETRGATCTKRYTSLSSLRTDIELRYVDLLPSTEHVFSLESLQYSIAKKRDWIRQEVGIHVSMPWKGSKECHDGSSSTHLKSCGSDETFRFVSSLGGDTPTAAPAFAFPSGDWR